MNILITGDSHLASLDRANQENPSITQQYDVTILPLGNSEASYEPYFKENGNGVDITLDRFQSYITQIPPAQTNIDVLAFSMPFHTLRMVRNARTWSQYTPYTVERSDRHVISHAAFKHMVLTQQQYNLALLSTLSNTIEKLVVVESPRLFAHHNLFKKIDSEIAIGVDRLYREVMNDALSERGISVAKCPVDTYDNETGLMKAEYRPSREEDQHHANTEFSMLMLQNIVHSIEAQPALMAA